MIEIETHPLTPFLPGNAKLLMLGSFPPPQNRWKMNFYYPNYQNDMWRIFETWFFFSDKNHFLDLPNKNFKESQIRSFCPKLELGYLIRPIKLNACRAMPQTSSWKLWLQPICQLCLSKYRCAIPLWQRETRQQIRWCSIFQINLSSPWSVNRYRWIMAIVS